jgi:hypothetical protein
MRIREGVVLSLCLGLGSCGSDDGGGSCAAQPASDEANCSATGTCPALAISGEAPASNPGTFKGYADPSLAADPGFPGRVWLAYSWPHVVPGQNPQGDNVQMAAVQNRLARSNNGGQTFSFVQVLWPDVAAADPEGSGENGRLSSETASLVTMTVAGATTWYGAHLRYFLRPMTGYNPKYGTSWHVRIGAAATPAALANATETVLGVTNTHAAYAPNVRLDQLAGLPVQHCAILNNPTLFVQGTTLYLIVECLAFVGPIPDYANTTTQVFATSPVGAPTSWTWRYAGKLGDAQLAADLGNDTIRQPDVSLAGDGTPIALITPAHVDAASPTGTVGDGCVALELDSIDPPVLARDCSGNPIVRARITGAGVGACTHDPASLSGIIATSQGAAGGDWALRASGVEP